MANRKVVVTIESLVSTTVLDCGTGCLIWTGRINQAINQPRVWYDGRECTAYKVLYELSHNMQLESGQRLKHICRNPLCMNIYHLEIQPRTDQERLVWLKTRGKVNENTGCLEWQLGTDRDGYGECNHKGRHYRAHRLVYILSNPTANVEGLVVRHLCNNPKCLNIDHLVLGTQADNVADRQVGPKAQIGSAHPQAKVDESQVLAIRDAYSKGSTLSTLADKYYLHPTTIHNIVTRKIWTHI